MSTPSSRGAEELVVFGPGGESRIIILGSEPISVGRAASNTLSYPEDGGLSRQHFVIERSDGAVVVRDLATGTELGRSAATGLRPGGLATLAGPVVVLSLPDRVIAFR